MKTLKTSLSFFFLLVFIVTGNTVSTIDLTDQDIFSTMRSELTVEQINDMTTVEIEKHIGKKFKLTEKAGLFLGKYKINRLLRKGYSSEEVEKMLARRDFSFSILGFLLGFFLSVIGILIAWLIWGRVGLKSSAFGAIFNLFLIWLARR